MNLKRVLIQLVCLLLVLLFREISAIANYQHDRNYLTEEDKRAAERDHIVQAGSHQTAYSDRQHIYPDYGTSATSFSSHGYSLYPQHQPTGGGGGYGYPSTGHEHYGAAQHGGGHSALALKGLLIPLAGIALLGAAAAFSTNPVLLQLGVLNGRKRRSVDAKIYPPNPHLVPLNSL